MDAVWTCHLAIVAAIVGQSACSQAQNASTDPVRVATTLSRPEGKMRNWSSLIAVSLGYS
jgi:hypothetical protein